MFSSLKMKSSNRDLQRNKKNRIVHLQVGVNDGLELDVGDDLRAKGSDELGPLLSQSFSTHQPEKKIFNMPLVDIIQARNRWRI